MTDTVISSDRIKALPRLPCPTKDMLGRGASAYLGDFSQYVSESGSPHALSATSAVDFVKAISPDVVRGSSQDFVTCAIGGAARVLIDNVPSFHEDGVVGYDRDGVMELVCAWEDEIPTLRSMQAAARTRAHIAQIESAN